MTTNEFAQSLRVRHEREAADRLEKLQQKCNMHYETICEFARERNAARAEVAQLRDTVAAYEQATVKESLTVRPEPSRLEIAAMLMQSIYARQYGTPCEFHAIQKADALIAAAKEAK